MSSVRIIVLRKLYLVDGDDITKVNRLTRLHGAAKGDRNSEKGTDLSVQPYDIAATIGVEEHLRSPQSEVGRKFASSPTPLDFGPDGNLQELPECPLIPRRGFLGAHPIIQLTMLSRDRERRRKAPLQSGPV